MMTRLTYLLISMPSRLRDDALSEVIGFILILALIAALASLYLTYVVPAQGREGEIKHMAGINDQFLGYKTAIDSLWINDQTNVPISRTFTLGTITGTTQGSFVIPIFQPYPSSGSMVVNGREETITISADALVEGFPGSATPDLDPVYYRPNHIYIQLMTTNTSKGGGITLKPNYGNWTISLNLTRFITPDQEATQSGVKPFPTPTSASSSISWTEFQTWINNNLNNVGGWISSLNASISSSSNTSSYITMTMTKNNNLVFSELPIVKNAQNNVWYTIDVVDSSYGIENELVYPFSISISNATSNWIAYRYPVSVGYVPKQITQSHQMGSLEFLSNNKYWIQQNYYYQQGGVFLAQPNDGMVTKVLPLISITNQTGIPTVRIVDITVKGSGNIGGTSPVQVISRLDTVPQNIFNGYTLAKGIPNAKNVTVTLTLQDTATAQMWNQTFAGIKSTAGGQSWIINTQNGNLATLTIDPIPSSPDYDIILDYSQVNMSVELQSVAI